MLVEAPASLRPLTAEEQLHWLALRLVPGLGTRVSTKVIQRFRTPQAVFQASLSELEAAGVTPGVARSISSGTTFDEAASQQEKVVESAVTLVPYTHPAYPERLREILDPPLLLFCMGRLELLTSPTLAIVGTRRPTPYGIAVTERLSADLSRAGLTITSGMARGIDTSAQKACLAVGGNTMSVLGCGVDVVYPAENRKLHADIAQQGLIVSEFPMASPPYPQNFPIRNRIVSGLAHGVLVIEGAEYSGSAITARLALEQGREVFAVPGNITNKMSWGPNLLIKQGAKLTQRWEDVFFDLPEDVRLHLSATAAQPSNGPKPVQANLSLHPMAALNEEILQCLQPDTTLHIDELLARVQNYSSSELIAALFELELEGQVKQLPGKNFVKVW